MVEATRARTGQRRSTLTTAAAASGYKKRIDRFLDLMNDRGASDLHFVVGQAPMLRLHGKIEPIRYRTLTAQDYHLYMREISPPAIWAKYQESGDADFAYEVPGLARFRVNLFRQVKGAGAVFRIIPSTIPTQEQLGMPSVIYDFAKAETGLYLVTGPTGSGKSTTLCSIIDQMNATRALHIITIEDPIEFVHKGKKALITQREVGTHATSFSSALHSAMREDPDVILVGEMRDLETIGLALAAAETGLVVFGTMHTNSAGKAVDRTINAFPTDEQDSVRASLSDNLQGVCAQQLLRRVGGGRIAAVEVLLGSPALGTLIRDGKTHQISNLIAMGKNRGMLEMDNSLIGMLRDELIAANDAYEVAVDKREMRRRIRKEFGISVGTGEDDDDGPI